MPFLTFEDLSEIVYRNISEYYPDIRKKDISVKAEGPTIVVMTDNADILGNEEVIRTLVSALKRRIKIKRKSGPKVSSKEAKKLIKNILPPEAGLKELEFYPEINEVSLKVTNPKEAIGENRIHLRKILVETGWYPIIQRWPINHAYIQEKIEKVLAKKVKEHADALTVIGKRIFRKTLIDNNDVRITILGAGREVGRSALLLRAGENNILIDCGVSLSGREIFPYFYVDEFSIDSIDAVIVTHAHLDHSGAVPFLFKYGYEGPVYTTPPTRDLMVLLQKDYVNVAEKENKLVPYSVREIEAELIRTIPLKYEEVTDIAPGVSISFYDAGHILGSAMVYIEVDRRTGEKTRILYTGDFRLRNTRLLSGAKIPPHPVNNLIMESTYGAREDRIPPRAEAEENLISIIKKTIERKGKILIPVLAVGRAQEIMLVIANAIENKLIPPVPVYLSGMVAEATKLHVSYPDYLSPSLKKMITQEGKDPLLSEEKFISVTDVDMPLNYGGPCIILSTSGMLSGGPSVYYFRKLAPDEKNTVIFVSYQVEGSLGRRVLDGIREIEYMDLSGKIKRVPIKLEVKKVEGFSGHADVTELIKFARSVRTRPKRLLLVHGQENKVENMISVLWKYYRPIGARNLETYRLI